MKILNTINTLVCNACNKVVHIFDNELILLWLMNRTRVCKHYNDDSTSNSPSLPQLNPTLVLLYHVLKRKYAIVFLGCILQNCFIWKKYPWYVIILNYVSLCVLPMGGLLDSVGWAGGCSEILGEVMVTEEEASSSSLVQVLSLEVASCLSLLVFPFPVFSLFCSSSSPGNWSNDHVLDTKDSPSWKSSMLK